MSQVKLDKLVLCRLNNLSTDAQRILRTSSIIGLTFSAKVLRVILPKHLKENLESNLETLCGQKWLYQDADCETNYRFAHSHAHRVIYQLTPLSERNLLHRSIADHIVATYPDDTTQYAAVCSHYQHCHSDLALQFLIKAVHVVLQTEDVFDYGDCIELMYGTFPCVQTTYDVDVVMKLIQEVAQGIHHCNSSNNTESHSAASAVGAFLASLFVLAVGKSASAESKNSAKVVPTNSDTLSNHSDHHVYVVKKIDGSESTDDLFSTSFDTETDDGESDLSPSLSAVDVETRTKRSFLSQLEKLNDQLSNKYSQLMRQQSMLESAESNGQEVIEPICAIMTDWQKVYLCKVQ